ncbi:MAG: OmpA family protein [Spirochaetes bacterium]|nr:OmpA family protein [Spirochaetota bacterium]
MKRVVLVSLFIAAISMIGCASQQPAPQQSEAPAVSTSSAMFINSMNEALKPAADVLEVFAPNSWTLTNRNKSLLSSKSVAIIKDVVNKLPEGYVVQVTGHSALVKEAPTDDVSTGRAKVVYDELIRAGINRNKLTYKGVGTAELLPGLDGLDPKQRRVSFKVVPK